MKSFVFLSSILACSLAITGCSGNKNAESVEPELEASCEVGPYTITNIAPSVYHIQDFNHNNPAGETFDESGAKTHFNNCSDIYLLAGSEKALLIDLSNYVQWDSTACESLRTLVADRIKGKPLTITFTHNHGDHTGMLPAFIDDPEVEFALPRIDFEALEDRFPNVRYWFYDEGLTFSLGGMNVNTVLVPGHTHGSMVFDLVGHDMIFTGDAIGSGHGVWIFNTEGYKEYVEAVPHLIEYIQNPANGIDTSKLTVWGGHYWQKDWFNDREVKDLDWQYILDMQTLITQIKNGEAYHEPSNLNFGALDTYFMLNNATIVWNLDQSIQWAEAQK